jgi:hypothetical protein
VKNSAMPVLRAAFRNRSTRAASLRDSHRDALAWMYERLTPNESLCCWQFTRSANRAYTLYFQGNDGNLVLYGPSGSTWSSGTGANRVVMQGDGNLVVYSPSRAICASNTASQANYGSYLRVQGDGNLVIYRPNGQAIWAKSWGSRCWGV